MPKIGGVEFEVPALDHDALMRREFGHTLAARHKLERRITAALYAHLAAAGWIPATVFDGEEETAVADAKAAMELIFNLDDAWLRFTKGEARHTVRLVLGNGQDIVCDWGYAEGDEDGFNAAMDAFLDLQEEVW